MSTRHLPVRPNLDRLKQQARDLLAAVRRGELDALAELFACVVTQPIRLRRSDEFARLLLDHGADPNVRATLRKQLRGADDETMHEYRDVTPLAWGERFHDQSFVSRPAMRSIAERGGRGVDQHG